MHQELMVPIPEPKAGPTDLDFVRDEGFLEVTIALAAASIKKTSYASLTNVWPTINEIEARANAQLDYAPSKQSEVAHKNLGRIAALRQCSAITNH